MVNIFMENRSRARLAFSPLPRLDFTKNDNIRVTVLVNGNISNFYRPRNSVAPCTSQYVISTKVNQLLSKLQNNSFKTVIVSVTDDKQSSI